DLLLGLVDRPRNRFRHARIARSGQYRLLHFDRQSRLLPGVEAASQINNVSKTRALQKAASNHAAVTTFAVHREWTRKINFRWRDFETVKRPPVRAFDMPSDPFWFAAHVEDIDTPLFE